MTSTKTTRIELLKKDKNIAKVIFIQKKDSFDVKICFQCDKYFIKGYKLFNEKPIIGEVTKNEDIDVEATYHSRTKENSPKIHFKTIVGDETKYDNMPLTKLSSPRVDSFIPFPLFKMEIPDNSYHLFDDKKLSHSSGRKYTEIEIGENYKIVELYMVSNESKVLMNYQPYGEMQTYFFSCNFECFCTNKIDPRRTPFFFKGDDKNVLREFKFIPMGDFKLILAMSVFPKLELTLEKPAITFIENGLSEAIFFHCLIKNHIEGKPNSKGLYIGNINIDNLKTYDVDNIENYWQRDSLSNILYRRTTDSNERAQIKQKSLDYLRMLCEEARRIA